MKYFFIADKSQQKQQPTFYMALIDLFDISKQYDSKNLLNGLEFHLHKGDQIAIIGKNGCGTLR